jgi:hypothetical protein
LQSVMFALIRDRYDKGTLTNAAATIRGSQFDTASSISLRNVQVSMISAARAVIILATTGISPRAGLALSIVEPGAVMTTDPFLMQLPYLYAYNYTCTVDPMFNSCPGTNGRSRAGHCRMLLRLMSN